MTSQQPSSPPQQDNSDSRVRAIAQGHERQQRPVIVDGWITPLIGAEPCLHLGAPGMVESYNGDERDKVGLCRRCGRRGDDGRQDGLEVVIGIGGPEAAGRGRGLGLGLVGAHGSLVLVLALGGATGRPCIYLYAPSRRAAVLGEDGGAVDDGGVVGWRDKGVVCADDGCTGDDRGARELDWTSRRPNHQQLVI